MMLMRGGRPVIGFADQKCPDNPPPRAGYSVWKGPVPRELTRWAIDLRDHVVSFPYGQEWTTRWGETDVVARKDHHRFTYRNGQLVTGICWPGITLYRPIPIGVTGLGDAPVLDPATAKPDPQLALYTHPPPEQTNWGLVAVGGAAVATTVGLFLWGMHAAGRR